jgi:hypothetical protein
LTVRKEIAVILSEAKDPATMPDEDPYFRAAIAYSPACGARFFVASLLRMTSSAAC